MRGVVFVTAVGVAMLATAAAGAPPNAAGTWHVVGTSHVGNLYSQATPTCVFIQSRENLGGTCTGPNAQGPITGTISGNSITWTWSTQATTAIGFTGILGFEGHFVTPRLIRGVMTSTGSPARGSFTASR
jgi:hypothetical protein